MDIKKILVSSAATLLLFLSLAAPALQVMPATVQIMGCNRALRKVQSETQCSGAGAFDVFGWSYNFGNKYIGAYLRTSWPQWERCRRHTDGIKQQQPLRKPSGEFVESGF